MPPATHALWDPPFAWGLALAGLTAVVRFVTRNRIIHRRQRLTFLALLALAVLHTALYLAPSAEQLAKGPLVEELLLTLAAISLLVSLVFNPWFTDRVRDRAPTIVQDTIVIGTFLLIGVFAFQEDAHLFATSALAGVVLGFALQDTLGTAFAGIAIQIDRPFRVGHWITVGEHEGCVVEVSWRATKIRTKSGNLVVLPNSFIAREAIQNYSEPRAATRELVDVGASCLVPPNEVRTAIRAALGRVPAVLADPPPMVFLQEFGDSAFMYRAAFWITDFEHDWRIKSDVRTAIVYEFGRRGIEIPWPTRVLYERQETAAGGDQADELVRVVAAVDVLASLSPAAHQALAGAAKLHVFGDGEAIVHEGDAGDSMFIIRKGRVHVVIGADRRLVATLETGAYFGEMSLLTGEVRAATVLAVGDVTVLEIAASTFRTYVQQNPEVVERIAVAAEARRRALDKTRQTSAEAQPRTTSLANRIRLFFGLS